MSLTTLSQIKAFLGLSPTNTGQDAQLDALRQAAESEIKTYCGRDLDSNAYTEFLTGNNTRALYLRQRPVTAIAAVYEDYTAYFSTNPVGAFSANTLLQPGVDYTLDLDDNARSLSGLLLRIRTVWSLPARIYTPGRLFPDNGPAFGNVKVTYTAGYSPVPQDIQYAVCFLVSYMKRTVTSGANLHSERIGDYSYELPTLRFPQAPEFGTIRQILARYRDIACQ